MQSSTWHHRLRYIPLLMIAAGCGGRDSTDIDRQRLDIAPPSATVRVGESRQLTAKVFDRSGDPMAAEVEWQSLDPQIATVDGDGNVAGIAVGTTSIRASSKGAVRSAPVTVMPELLLTASLTEVEFAAVESGDPPPPQAITVTTSEGGEPEGLTASVTYAAGGPDGWLAVAVEDGGASVPIAVDHADLAVGTHEAVLTLASPVARQPLAIAVRLLVLEQQPAIALDTTRASFSAPQGGADPPAKSIAITNAGGGVLEGLTASVTYPDREPAGWLTATIDDTAPGELTLQARVGSLPAGIYTANVEVAAAAAQNSPQHVTVTFSVGAPVPLIALDRATLDFAAVQGGADPAAQPVAITNVGAGTLSNLVVSTTYPSGQPDGWLTTALSATTAPATLLIGVDAGSLNTGTWTATVRVSSVHAPNSPQTVAVTVQVDEPPVGSEPPAAPSGLAATAITAAQIDLTWTDNSSDETAFHIERSTDQAVWTSIYATAPGVTTYADATAHADITYYYRVAACRGSVCSAQSNTASATTSNVPPAAPRVFSASVLSSTSIDLSWNTAEGTVLEYRLERRTGAAGTFVQVATLASSLRQHRDENLSPSTSYVYRIRACNSIGCSPYTPEINVSTIAH